MSFPPRPPMGGGVHDFMRNMAMGMPPPTSQPPPFFSGPPPVRGNQVRPPMNMSIPPPVSRNHQPNQRSDNAVIHGKPRMNADHPLPMPQPIGPAVTVFVGNITDKWPDAMIRQLLATCGQVLNWKRVQGASGKLQGFGFCDYNGPDAGLRAVRLLHDLEVGDKKLVVKVDAKTSSVLDKYKADKKKSKEDETEEGPSEEKETQGDKDDSKDKNGNGNEAEDYMDKEMVEMDERSKLRIDIIFREFKSELEQYGAAASSERPPRNSKEKAEKDPAAKQGLQDKLHLLKLSSLDPTPNDNPPEDLEVEEGKREIISQEIGKFREYMKQEKEKEDERKKQARDHRRDRDRDEPSDRRMEHSPGMTGSPIRRRSRDRSPRRDFRRRSRERQFDRVPRDRDAIRDRENRDWGNRDRRRSRDRDRRSISMSRDRDRSPGGLSKSKYREREEEEEARDLKTQERKAREKEQAYEEKVRVWERKEIKKLKEMKITRERQKRVEEESERDARRMKQFLEDYDDEKHDPKYYKGKELQKRLAERTKELEADNRDRQREREELEEMRLRVLTGGGNPAELFEKYKKPILEVPPVSLHLTQAIKLTKKPTLTAGVGNSRQPPHLSQNSSVSQALHQLQQPTLTHPQASPSLAKASTYPYKSPTPINNNRSNSTTPNSFTSPAQAHAPELSASVKSLANTGFLQLAGVNSNSNNSVTKEETDSRQSFSDGNSPGGPSPGGNSGHDDDSSLHEMSPEYLKKKKIEVHEIFNQDEDEGDGLGTGRKRKLVPLDYGEEGKKSRKDEKSQEDKKKHIKSLIDRIPTDKEALFEFVIDWDMVDNTLMEKRIRPWINKKIVEYIGEPEPTLVDFICSKVLTQSSPQSILDDVMQVLDEEAEVFVVKMWRLLVYEIEAKKYGIASKT